MLVFFLHPACMLSCFNPVRADCGPPGSSVHGILQTRILEEVAVFFSWGCSQYRDQTWVSYISCTGRQVFYQALSLLRLFSAFSSHPHLIFIQEKNNKSLPLAHAGQISPSKNPGAKVTSSPWPGKWEWGSAVTLPPSIPKGVFSTPRGILLEEPGASC